MLINEQWNVFVEIVRLVNLYFENGIPKSKACVHVARQNRKNLVFNNSIKPIEGKVRTGGEANINWQHQNDKADESHSSKMHNRISSQASIKYGPRKGERERERERRLYCIECVYSSVSPYSTDKAPN